MEGEVGPRDWQLACVVWRCVDKARFFFCYLKKIFCAQLILIPAAHPMLLLPAGVVGKKISRIWVFYKRRDTLEMMRTCTLVCVLHALYIRF